MVKNLPTKQETWFHSLGREDSLEKEMATHSSILVWEIPGTEEPGMLHSIGSQRVRHDFTTKQQHCGSGTVLNFTRVLPFTVQQLHHCPHSKDKATEA